MNDIIILGMGPSRVDCPFDSETWGVNTGYRQVKTLGGKLDKLFICHRGQEYDWEGDPIFDWDEKNELIDSGVEIVTLFDIAELKRYTKMPFVNMVEHFRTEYFSDSIAYMAAYAIYRNTIKVDGALKLQSPMRLRFYGVDMHTKDEYATERGGIEYFIAIAKTIGADVWIHPDSVLCRTDTGKPYGFATVNTKQIDPHNIMELQKTPDGVRELWKKDIISEKQKQEMLAVFEAESATGLPKAVPSTSDDKTA
jgi:hypothetical protein